MRDFGGWSANPPSFLAASVQSAGYNGAMPESPRYTAEHAQAGLDAEFPEIETWPNQFCRIPKFWSTIQEVCLGLPENRIA